MILMFSPFLCGIVDRACFRVGFILICRPPSNFLGAYSWANPKSCLNPSLLMYIIGIISSFVFLRHKQGRVNETQLSFWYLVVVLKNVSSCKKKTNLSSNSQPRYFSEDSGYGGWGRVLQDRISSAPTQFSWLNVTYI